MLEDTYSFCIRLQGGIGAFCYVLDDGVFYLAIDDGIMEKNPTLRVMNEIEGQQERREALTVEQQEDLLAYMRNRIVTIFQKEKSLIYTIFTPML